MVVVEHQQRLVRIRPGGQFVDQRGHQPLVRRRRGRAEQRPHPFGEPRPHPGPARPHHGARTAPGRYRRRPATATPPAAGRAAPSRPAGPSCRTPPGRRPASARAPGPRRGVPPTAGAVPGPGAAWADAAWWPARHLARRPLPMGPRRAAQPYPPPCPVFPPVTAHDERECGRHFRALAAAEDSTWHVHFRVTPRMPGLRYLRVTPRRASVACTSRGLVLISVRLLEPTDHRGLEDTMHPLLTQQLIIATRNEMLAKADERRRARQARRARRRQTAAAPQASTKGRPAPRTARSAPDMEAAT